MADRRAKLDGMSGLTVLVLAAGASRRMRGGDKLLERIDGVQLLRRQVLAAMATECNVVICLPADAPERMAAVADLAVTRFAVTDAAEGMGASIRTGVAALPEGCAAVMILPADMPELDTRDLRAVARSWQSAPDAVHRGASASGRPGHPVIFPARLFGRLITLSGDTGAREVMAGEDVRLTPLPDAHALTDLDTPEDWRSWRARR